MWSLEVNLQRGVAAGLYNIEPEVFSSDYSSFSDLT